MTPDELKEVTTKIAQCHDLMDAAGVFTAEETHPQLVARLGMLIAERDRLAAENAALLAALDGLLNRAKNADYDRAAALLAAKQKPSSP